MIDIIFTFNGLKYNLSLVSNQEAFTQNPKLHCIDCIRFGITKTSSNKDHVTFIVVGFIWLNVISKYLFEAKFSFFIVFLSFLWRKTFFLFLSSSPFSIERHLEVFDTPLFVVLADLLACGGLSLSWTQGFKIRSGEKMSRYNLSKMSC